MSGYVLSPLALEDIFQIWSYYSSNATIELADRIESQLFGAIDTIVTNPGIGHTRSDLTTAPVRFFRIYQFMIVYRLREQLEIVRVLHGKRDLKGILSGTESSQQ